MFSRNVTERKERKKLPLWYRAVSAAVTTIAVVAVCFCLVLALIAKAGEGGKQIFGYVVLRVESGSMEPTLAVGDVLLFDACDGTEVREGDIVVFRAPYGTYEGRFVTHRVTEVSVSGDGEVLIRTKGDAASGQDSWTLTAGDIVGVYEKTLPVITDVSAFLQSAGGSMLVIGLPLILLVVVFVADKILSDRMAAKEKGEKADASSAGE